MKILSIGNFTTGWDGSICDEEHIAKALEDLGHEVTRQQREERIYGPYEGSDVGFILIAQWDSYNPYIREAIRKHTQAPIVYWAFDYQAEGQEWHERLIQQSDLYLSKRIADSKYSNWQWLSQDFSPMFLDRAPAVDKDIEVLFTGSYLPWASERNEILKAVDDKFNLTIHTVTPDQFKGLGFKNVYGPIMDDGLPGLYARAKINLSIDHTIEAGYWSDRNAQIMACGGFVLFRYVPLSESRFGAGVEYFYNTADCLEKIDQFLIDEPRREYIADYGYKMVHDRDNLKVTQRAYDLLTIVGSIL